MRRIAFLLLFVFFAFSTAAASPQNVSVSPHDYYIVGFSGPITDAQRASVESSGLEIVGYAGNFSYIARTPIGAVPIASGFTIEKMGNKPMKAMSSMAVAANSTLLTNIIVVLYPGEDADGMVNAISAIAPAQKYDEQTVVVNSATEDQLSEIRSIPGVIGADPKMPNQVFNNYAAPVLGVSDVWSRLGLNGNSTIVAVTDTGLDTGNLLTMNLDFRGRVTISAWCDGSFAHYMLGIYCPGNPSGADYFGHGTHVSGSVLGNGTNSNGTIKGMAYGASLFMQSLDNSSNNTIYTPYNLQSLFTESYSAGARFDSNSWGDNYYHYDSSSSYFIDDFSYQHPDFLILFAASNNGSAGADTISSEGQAKNDITVGAVGTTRGPVPGFNTNGPTQIASFSSRGPASDGRYKPDLVAPGVDILSTKSSIPGTVACNSAFSDGFTTSYSGYAFCSGTS